MFEVKHELSITSDLLAVRKGASMKGLIFAMMAVVGWGVATPAFSTDASPPATEAELQQAVNGYEAAVSGTFQGVAED